MLKPWNTWKANSVENDYSRLKRGFLGADLSSNRSMSLEGTDKPCSVRNSPRCRSVWRSLGGKETPFKLHKVRITYRTKVETVNE